MKLSKVAFITCVVGMLLVGGTGCIRLTHETRTQTKDKIKQTSNSIGIVDPFNPDRVGHADGMSASITGPTVIQNGVILPGGGASNYNVQPNSQPVQYASGQTAQVVSSTPTVLYIGWANQPVVQSQPAVTYIPPVVAYASSSQAAAPVESDHSWHWNGHVQFFGPDQFNGFNGGGCWNPSPQKYPRPIQPWGPAPLLDQPRCNPPIVGRYPGQY